MSDAILTSKTIWIINVVLFVLIVVSLLLYFSVFKKKTKSECEINDDCTNGKICLNKMCIIPTVVKKCIPDCVDGKECVNGECVVKKCIPDCVDGKVCISGECVVKKCIPDCVDGKVCISGECIGITGSLCDQNKDCESNACGLVTGYPHPQCCAGHTFMNYEINRNVCSLGKGYDCSTDSMCTSMKCVSDGLPVQHWSPVHTICT